MSNPVLPDVIGVQADDVTALDGGHRTTIAGVEDRLDSVHDFLDLLEGVENELTAPTPEAVVNPIDARVNDRLAGGFVVKKRLGKGSTSVALLVERDGQEGVLKVALEPVLNPRLIEEGRTCASSATPTLSSSMSRPRSAGMWPCSWPWPASTSKPGPIRWPTTSPPGGRLSLDLLQRFGEELLIVAD